MMTFKTFCELRLNGKQVATPKGNAVQPGQRAEFPGNLNVLANIGIPLFDPSDDDMERWLAHADRRRVRFVPRGANNNKGKLDLNPLPPT